MRWTWRCVRRARLPRTAKACGPGTPGLVPSERVWRRRPYRADAPKSARDGDSEVMDTGESAQISVKTIAQGMSMFRLRL